MVPFIVLCACDSRLLDIAGVGGVTGAVGGGWIDGVLPPLPPPPQEMKS